MTGRISICAGVGLPLPVSLWDPEGSSAKQANPGTGIRDLGRAKFKPLPGRVDTTHVRISATKAGLSLALGAAILVGLGEWASGGFGSGSLHSDGGDPAIRTAHTHSPDASSETPGFRDPMGPGVGSLRGGSSAGYDPPTNLALSSDFTFRNQVREVRLQFSVVDKHGRFVENLSPNEILLMDNNRPVERFQSFTRIDDLPLRLGIVLDASDSVKKSLAAEKKAATAFLQKILRPHTDQAFFLSFGSGVQFLQSATNDRSDLVLAVARVRDPGNGTRLYDALYKACQEENVAVENPVSHHVLLLISDGEDTTSARGLQDVIRAAQRHDIEIYSLTVHPKRGVFPGDEVLQRLSDATGGTFYVAYSEGALNDALTAIGQAIRMQYSLYYRPPEETPGYHVLHIAMRTSGSFRIHARSGYYAQ